MSDYFEDGPQSDTPPPMDKKDDGAGKSDAPTFLINAEVCPDMKPGERLELRIVAVHDNEYEVAYQDKQEEKEEGDEPAPEEPAPEPAPNPMMD